MILLIIGLMASANVRVLMIDAGSPNVKGMANVGSNRSSEATKDNIHIHSDAMFQFITTSSCPKYRVDWCNIYDKKGFNTEAYEHCLKLINQYDIVNLSITGGGGLKYEQTIILKTRKDTRIIAAAGNEGRPWLMYPAVFTKVIDRVIAVSALDENGNRPKYSNYDKDAVPVLGYGKFKDTNGEIKEMNGTSVAAARYTATLINKQCKQGEKK